MEKRALTFNKVSWGKWGEQGTEQLSRFLSALNYHSEVLSDLETNSVMPFWALKSFATLYTTWKTFHWKAITSSVKDLSFRHSLEVTRLLPSNSTKEQSWGISRPHALNLEHAFACVAVKTTERAALRLWSQSWLLIPWSIFLYWRLI